MDLPSHQLLISLVMITTVAYTLCGLTGFGATFLILSDRLRGLDSALSSRQKIYCGRLGRAAGRRYPAWPDAMRDFFRVNAAVLPEPYFCCMVLVYHTSERKS
jgi:hypothetical protein